MKKTISFAALMVTAFLIISFSQDKNLEESMKRGKEVYLLHCQNCHMENGQGMEGVNPPVAKTTYLKDTKKNIDIILNGQTGEVVVNGKKYNAIMNPMNYLDDRQIADVLNYIRNSWGNKYPIVTPAQVKTEREKPAKTN
ncbi:MAG TPA: cytochrome c [Chitinophagaceae bacterium]|nr:cytochrome c [Chitinophagaceae bacterium]